MQRECLAEQWSVRCDSTSQNKGLERLKSNNSKSQSNGMQSYLCSEMSNSNNLSFMTYLECDF